MRKFTVILLFVAALFAVAPAAIPAALPDLPRSSFFELYHHAGLDSLVDFPVFEKAITGYNRIQDKKKAILALIDFSKPSTRQRLFVIDLQQEKLLFASLVAHGKNSGENYATSFSNKPGSGKSSLGFFLTEDSYISRRCGYSLQLKGLENGINDNAMARGVVVHGADYCDPDLVAGNGRLGRSFGCPAVPEELSGPIIDTLKGGAVLFIYAPDRDYLAHSRFFGAANS